MFGIRSLQSPRKHRQNFGQFTIRSFQNRLCAVLVELLVPFFVGRYFRLRGDGGFVNDKSDLRSERLRIVKLANLKVYKTWLFWCKYFEVVPCSCEANYIFRT
ncbi:hypothetical protein L596_008454 [Steinernema carpocapsae]|uniref:Uncharacterized protein n=1 Tax=Steinernema carpocapsae TaxID=34508 RepID=A0A4V6A6B2_STECR|nr:hypothetical protein L596_008454 [Steinernema carpocapsae]